MRPLFPGNSVFMEQFGVVGVVGELLFSWNGGNIVMGFFSHTWIGCLLAILPGPPRVKFDNAQFRLFPVDKSNKYCPEIEESRDVGFYLFSREFPEKPHELRLADHANLASSNLDFELPTVIYFPPFFDGVDGRNVKEVKEGYLRRGGYNLIVVGSERLSAGPWYPAAVSNTFVVGRHAAAFVDYLVGAGLPLKNLWLQGLSIGAHAAGVAGRYMRSGRPPRITGLDPSSFLFAGKHLDMRLDSSDADFVDVIHTDGLFGMFYPIGHVDFFVDPDVYPQPGCEIENILARSRGLLFAVFCSHLRSNKLFAMSITHPKLFPGKKCSSWKRFRSGLCRSDSVEFMGLDTPSTARGIYFVSTRDMPSGRSFLRSEPSSSTVSAKQFRFWPTRSDPRKGTRKNFIISNGRIQV